MIEEVIPHTQLLARTQQGWQNEESFLMLRTAVGDLKFNEIVGPA